MDGVGESACVRFFITNSMQFSPLTVHLSVQRATTKSVSTSIFQRPSTPGMATSRFSVAERRLSEGSQEQTRAGVISRGKNVRCLGRSTVAPRLWRISMRFPALKRRARIKGRSAAGESSLEISDERSNDVDTTARPALRRANVVEAKRADGDRRAQPGARHRREHGALQCGGRDVAQKAAGQRS